MSVEPDFAIGDLFSRSAKSLVQALVGTTVENKPTPISKFKASYNTVLDGANSGRAQVILQGKKRYLLLSEDQVIALAQQNAKPRSLADMARGLETPVGSMGKTQVTSARSKGRQLSLPDRHGKR